MKIKIVLLVLLILLSLNHSFVAAKVLENDVEVFWKNASSAQITLRALSTASEQYAATHTMIYPTNVDLLKIISPKEIKINYCNQIISDYQYSCEMSHTGYTFKAKLIKGLKAGRLYTVETGGIMTWPIDSESEKEEKQVWEEKEMKEFDSTLKALQELEKIQK